MKIENFWPVMAFLIEGGNVLPELGSKPSYLEKLISMGRLTDELAALGMVDWSAAANEALNLDEESIKELHRRAVQKFDIPDDIKEAKIEAWIGLAIRQIDIFAEGYHLIAN